MMILVFFMKWKNIYEVGWTQVRYISDHSFHFERYFMENSHTEWTSDVRQKTV